jgi:hypothetical protein
MTAETKELIALIRRDIGIVRAEGGVSVTIESLETLLDTVEDFIAKHPNTEIPLAIEQAKLQHASTLAQYEAQAASARELFKSVIAMATLTIKSLILINGGAAVALLAFIGHLATAETTETSGQAINAFAAPLLWFVIGVGTAAFFAGFVAAAQKLYAEPIYAAEGSKKKRLKSWGNASVVISILFGLCSLLAFAVGSCFAYCVLSTM